jgi:hypothetical protein
MVPSLARVRYRDSIAENLVVRRDLHFWPQVLQFIQTHPVGHTREMMKPPLRFAESRSGSVVVCPR